MEWQDINTPQDALEFEPLPPEEVAAEKKRREDALADRNERDRLRAEAIASGQLERAFNARPVGDTTAGKLNPL